MAEGGGGDGNSSPGAAHAIVGNVVAHRTIALNKAPQYPLALVLKSVSLIPDALWSQLRAATGSLQRCRRMRPVAIKDHDPSLFFLECQTSLQTDFESDGRSIHELGQAHCMNIRNRLLPAPGPL